MMQLGVDYQVILDIYYKEIRSILEFGAVVFHSSLSQKLSSDLESIQKLVLFLISKHLSLKLSYSESCILFNTEPLSSRRYDICSNFVRRNKHSGLFSTVKSSYNTRKQNCKFKEFKCNSSRFYSSLLVYLTRLPN